MEAGHAWRNWRTRAVYLSLKGNRSPSFFRFSHRHQRDTSASFDACRPVV